jgi:splicing factor 3B subunit 3
MVLKFCYNGVAEEYDAYIIVSFVNATLVLSIGETVEEVTDSGFLGTTPTLSCSALGEDALVQVSVSQEHLCNHWHYFVHCS